MRMIVATVLAVTLSATSLWAADASNAPVVSANTSALAPGRPAGVQKAQGIDNLAWYLVGAGALAGIIVIAAQNGGAQLGTTSTQ